MKKNDLDNRNLDLAADTMIREKIKAAFEEVCTGDLKTPTLEFVRENQTKTEKNSRKRLLFPAIPAMAGGFFAVILAVLIPLYFFPTVFISVDINPSLELGINRLNRVVSVKGFNDDGKTLAKKLDIRFMDYREALNSIMKTQKITELLDSGGLMSFCVVGRSPNRTQEANILSTLEEKTKKGKNTFCHYADFKDVKEAHHKGLSYGKYKAFLQLQKNYPGIKPENFSNIPMKDIHRMLENCRENEPDTPKHSEIRQYQEEDKKKARQQNLHHRRGKGGNGKKYRNWQP